MSDTTVSDKVKGYPVGRKNGRKVWRNGKKPHHYQPEMENLLRHRKGERGLTPIRSIRAKHSRKGAFTIYMWDMVLNGKVVKFGTGCVYIVRTLSWNNKYRYELFHQAGIRRNYRKEECVPRGNLPRFVPRKFEERVKEAREKGIEFLDYTGYKPKE